MAEESIALSPFQPHLTHLALPRLTSIKSFASHYNHQGAELVDTFYHTIKRASVRHTRLYPSWWIWRLLQLTPFRQIQTLTNQRWLAITFRYNVRQSFGTFAVAT